MANGRCWYIWLWSAALLRDQQTLLVCTDCRVTQFLRSAPLDESGRNQIDGSAVWRSARREIDPTPSFHSFANTNCVSFVAVCRRINSIRKNEPKQCKNYFHPTLTFFRFCQCLRRILQTTPFLANVGQRTGFSCVVPLIPTQFINITFPPNRIYEPIELISREFKKK